MSASSNQFISAFEGARKLNYQLFSISEELQQRLLPRSLISHFNPSHLPPAIPIPV